MATPQQSSEPGRVGGDGVDAGQAGSGMQDAVAALRERGAQQADPVRWRFIEALARRAEGQPAAVRQRLEATLSRALAECAERCAQAPAEAEASRSTAQRPAPGPLAGLVQQLRRSPAAADAPTITPAAPAPPRGPGSAGAAPDSAAGLRGSAIARPGAAPATGPGPAAGHDRHDRHRSAGRAAAAPAAPVTERAQPNELQALAYFRRTWARLAVNRSMNQSLAKTPKNAGPLNSHRLVLRALQLMQETSPAYLNRFVSYVDALLALERMGDPAPAAAAHAPPAEGEKKRKQARG